MNISEKIIDNEFSDSTLEILNKYDHLRLHVKDSMKAIAWEAWKEASDRKDWDVGYEQNEFEKWYNKQV